MPLSWNEIKHRASEFAREWRDEANEDAEAKTFWDGFFNVFGITRKRVAYFEQQVKKLDNRQGFIDVFWPGMMLAEHKSRGKNLDRAYTQAMDYFPGLAEKDLPRYIIVSDFARIRLYDLEENTHQEFALNELVQHVSLFGFIAGYQKRSYKEQDPVNIKAAELMGRLHDKLKDIGYTGHRLEVYLVRLLFCLFADDTTIFEPGIFREFIETRTSEDGSDLAARMEMLFEVLNTPEKERLKNLDESLSALPYVNGKLFEERLSIASFDSDMRGALLDCCALDWGKISPAIFGSLFQSVMNAKERRNLGAHYTSEKNILKLIKPLFMDELWREFESVKNSLPKLKKFHEKISQLRFLDPACGCGNFLIIAYRELRMLEMEIIKTMQKGQQVIDVSDLIRVDVDQFYGIEFEEFPAQIAQVAMWLMDHQMNMKVSEEFGNYYIRLPLRKSAVIVHGNALRIDWQSMINPIPWEKKESRFDFIFGNPPFIGKHLMNDLQKEDMSMIFKGVQGAGLLDYVTAWYIKAANYMQGSETKAAFVSTNSISQGEQVGILWNELFTRYKIKILFAHRTFKWGNEGRGNAAVHVVIIGFASFDIPEKYIYEYEDIKGEPHVVRTLNINPYLVDGKDILIVSRSKPICNVPEMVKGSQPTDGGHFLFTDVEKEDFIRKEPNAIKYIKPFLSAHEFINGERRWCLWLKNASPHDLREMPLVLQRIKGVKEMRLKSKKEATRKWAEKPNVFTEDRQPDGQYILVPSHSSENRKYIPIAFLSQENILNNSCFSISNATNFQFGILTSIMHMTWVKYVCGRLKSDYRYSNSIVYNNFPWPENPTEKQKQAVENAAHHVLDVRKQFPDSSLADLYDPNSMPPELTKAHQALDKAVDLCYRPQPFPSETKRIEFLFELYDKYTSGLFVKEKKAKKKAVEVE